MIQCFIHIDRHSTSQLASMGLASALPNYLYLEDNRNSSLAANSSQSLSEVNKPAEQSCRACGRRTLKKYISIRMSPYRLFLPLAMQSGNSLTSKALQ